MQALEAGNRQRSFQNTAFPGKCKAIRDSFQS
jgi:hypothetical protein